MVPQQQFGLRVRQNSSFLLALFLLSVALLACNLGGKKCTATLTYQGRKYTGVDAKKEKAISNACNKYCREDDPEYDAMYRIWLDSPAGRVAGRPSKQEAIFKDSRLMDFVTITCANKCVAWTDNGTAKVETDCD